MTRKLHRLAVGASLVALACAVMGAAVAQEQVGGVAIRGPTPTLDPAKELPTKIKGPFTVAAVGDATILRPIGQEGDPDTQAALKIIRDADIGFANMESNIADPPEYSGPLRGFVGVAEVARDLHSWGIDLMNKAGNHGFDSGPEGLLETLRLLREAGIQYAGSGRNLSEARAARFLETPKGRVGVEGGYSVGGLMLNDSRAADSWGNDVRAQAGQNNLRMTPSYVIAPDQIASLRSILNSMFVVDPEITTQATPPRAPATAEDAQRIQFGGTTYQSTGTPGTVNWEIDPEDLRQNLRAIRGGKQYADFMIATIHAHQGKWVAEKFPEETTTPDYLVRYAHATIDNGADTFVGHGPHALRGVEIYKGRPIFYGLGQFVRQSDWRVPSRGDYDAFGITPDKTDLTAAELGVLRTAGPGYRSPAMYRSIIALSKWDGGQLREVRLYPVDLGYERPLSQVGVPRLAKGAVAREILAHMQKVSRPFGTVIAIVGDVGVIRVAASGRE